MSELLKLPNVGKVLENLLLKADISTIDQLQSLGAEEVFLKVREIDPSACVQMLYGIQGAIDGIRDTKLDKATKDRLKAFFRSLDEHKDQLI